MTLQEWWWLYEAYHPPEKRPPDWDELLEFAYEAEDDD